MIKEPQVSLFDIAVCLSTAMDLVSPVLINHHKRVACIAFSMGTELGLSTEEQNNLLLAGLLHDSGALSLKERLETLQFEVVNPHKHAEAGYFLLKNFKPLSKIASFVRYHHIPYNERKGLELKGEEVSMESQILHLADRAEVLINKQQEILGQAKKICEKIEEYSGEMFAPQLVHAFKSLATKEYFWLNLVFPSAALNLLDKTKLPTIELGMEELLSLTDLFSQIVDFRSRFTATHSSGVAASAETLARFIGFPERKCRMIRVAGYLHDLGKLSVPTEILEKPAKLTEDEFNIVKAHPFYTYRILETIEELNTINAWASFHHEHLNGKGYPFHIKGEDISTEARIMAVADVFTAIAEDRPYRKGMAIDRALEVLEQMAKDGVLDSKIISTLRLHYSEIELIRTATQAYASRKYQEFMQENLKKNNFKIRRTE